MIRHLLFSIGVCIITMQSLFATTATPAPKKPWTFLIYMAADNSLQPDADINIDELKKIGSTENVNILVHLNTKRPNEPKITQRLLIHKGSVEQFGPTQDLDSGNADTLIDAMKWAYTNFPADHYALDLWDHGSGPLNRTITRNRGCCYDDSTGNFFTDADLAYALDTIQKSCLNGQKLDIIAFDACLMADLEIAFLLQPFAHYQVSSQQTIPGLGFAYTDVFALFQSKAPTAREVGLQIVKTYQHFYTIQQEEFTLSLISLDALNPLLQAHKTISTLLEHLLQSSHKSKVHSAIAYAASHALHFEEPTCMDLSMFYSNLLSKVSSLGLSAADARTLSNALMAGKKAIAIAVLAHVASSRLAKSQGISIYFPQGALEETYPQLIWSQNNPWLSVVSSFAQSSSL